MPTRMVGLICRGICLFLFCVHSLRSEENVSVGKAATQSIDHDPRYPASKAVDGCVKRELRDSNCCSHTSADDKREAWWQVDLGNLSTINYVTIIHRNDYDSRGRFGGYQLYLSNTTDWTQGVLCYEDRSSSKAQVQMVVTHQCPYVAQFVSIYIYRGRPTRYDWYESNAMLELCEVQVYGCPIKKYGNGICNETCSDNCYGGNCDASTGTCFYCPRGMRGDMCDQDCSSDCKGRLCDKDSGFCEECIEGKHGNECEQNCSENCKDGVCAKDTGRCDGCIRGKRGHKCELDCPINCQDGQCAQDTGYCSGCAAGKYGDFCLNDCPVNCLDNTCEKHNGQCIGCISGKHGAICDLNCPQQCNNSVCMQTTGQCKECIVGRYGLTCDRNCPPACKDNACSINEGKCLYCNTGRHGGTCTLTCPVTCKDFLCDQQTGQCLDCYPGKYGVVCWADCPDTCEGNICNKEDGQCQTIGADTKLIVIAVLAVICGLMLVVFITLEICLFRKVRNKKDSADHNTEASEPDPNYTALSGAQELTPNVYEMIGTK